MGELAFAFGVVTPVSEVLKLRLGNVLATDVRQEHPLSRYLTIASALGVLGGPIAVLAAGLLGASKLVLAVMA